MKKPTDTLFRSGDFPGRIKKSWWRLRNWNWIIVIKLQAILLQRFPGIESWNNIIIGDSNFIPAYNKGIPTHHNAPLFCCFGIKKYTPFRWWSRLTFSRHSWWGLDCFNYLLFADSYFERMTCHTLTALYISYVTHVDWWSCSRPNQRKTYRYHVCAVIFYPAFREPTFFNRPQFSQHLSFGLRITIIVTIIQEDMWPLIIRIRSSLTNLISRERTTHDLHTVRYILFFTSPTTRNETVSVS